MPAAADTILFDGNGIDESDGTFDDYGLYDSFGIRWEGYIRIPESEVVSSADVDAKLVFLAASMRAKLLTTDYNLAKMAEFQGVPWLNLNQLAKALQPDLIVGEDVEVELLKPGTEEGQAVGFLADGSMVVVTAGRPHIGRRVRAEIVSVIPSAGGKMIFARLIDSVA